MATIITEANLASYLQRKITTGKAQYVVDLANRLVTEDIGDLANGTADADTGKIPVPARVETITLEVAARAFRNPAGVTSETRAIDDWSRTQRWEAAAAKAGVFLTDDEGDELRELAGTRPTRKTRSIQLRVPGYQS